MDVVESVLARMQHQFLATVLEEDIFAHRGIVIVRIAGGFHEEPVQLAGIQIQGNGGRGVPVLARPPGVRVHVHALVAAIIIVRVGVPGTDDDLVVGVIDGSGLP